MSPPFIFGIIYFEGYEKKTKVMCFFCGVGMGGGEGGLAELVLFRAVNSPGQSGILQIHGPYLLVSRLESEISQG